MTGTDTAAALLGGLLGALAVLGAVTVLLKLAGIATHRLWNAGTVGKAALFIAFLVAMAATAGEGHRVTAIIVSAIYPASVIALRWLHRRRISSLMYGPDDAMSPDSSLSAAAAQRDAAAEPIFVEHGRATPLIRAQPLRELRVARELRVLKRSVVVDVAPGLATVALLLAAGALTGGATLVASFGFMILAALFVALGALRYLLVRQTLRANRDAESARVHNRLIPNLSRLLGSPVISAGWGVTTFAFQTGLGVIGAYVSFSSSPQMQGHRLVGALLLAALLIGIVLKVPLWVRGKREEGPALLVLRIFGNDWAAALTFDRVLRLWSRFGNYFTILDLSLWKHRNPVISLKTLVVLLPAWMLISCGPQASGIVGSQWPDWQLGLVVAAFALTAAAVYAVVIQAVVWMTFIRQPAQLARIVSGFRRRARLADLRFRSLEVYCTDRMWQQAVAAFANESSAVLVDLRGYRAHSRKGCEYELRFLALPITSKNRWTFPIASPIVVDGCTERDQADLKAGCLDRSGPTALGRQGVRDSGFVCGLGLPAFRFP